MLDKKICKKFQGFSLLEVTVAIALILVGLLGIMSLNSQNITAQNLNKNTLIASQLAQEGIELARNKRDSFWLDGAGDLSAGEYWFDYVGEFALVNEDEDANLKINGLGFYSHTGDTPSVFSRLVEVAEVVEGEASYLKLTSTVLWQERGKQQEYKLETHLYDWN